MDALDAKHAADEERAKVMANVRRVMAPVGNIFMRGVFTLVNKAAGNASYALLHFTGRQTLSRLRQSRSSRRTSPCSRRSLTRGSEREPQGSSYS